MIQNHYGESETITVITATIPITTTSLMILMGRGEVKTTTSIEVKIVTRIGRTGIITIIEVVIKRIKIVEDTKIIMDRTGTIIEIMMMRVETTI